MRLSLSWLGGAALALGLFTAAGARADLIPYTYQWTAGQLAVGAGTGGVSFTSGSPQSVVGPTGGPATDLRTFSAASYTHPDTFLNVPYSLTVHITDSGIPGALTFTGVLNGTLSMQSANILNTFTSPVTQSTTINGDTYTVTIGPYSAPGIPSDPDAGNIGAHIDVKGPKNSGPGGNPEPSTAVLSCLGAGVLGLVSWRRWRRRHMA
jgi:hypothetical protein